MTSIPPPFVHKAKPSSIRGGTNRLESAAIKPGDRSKQYPTVKPNMARTAKTMIFIAFSFSTNAVVAKQQQVKKSRRLRRVTDGPKILERPPNFCKFGSP